MSRITYADKPAGAYDHDVVPGFCPVTWADLKPAIIEVPEQDFTDYRHHGDVRNTDLDTVVIMSTTKGTGL